jgi:ABC-type sugar transport system substrate-binding protein
MKSLKRLATLACASAFVAAGLSMSPADVKAEGSGTLQGDGKAMVMFVMTASNVYGANQINGAKQEAERLGWDLTVFQHNFSQPEQDAQVQQYIASGAEPEVIIFWPWVADAAINAVRQLARLAPVIQLTQEPNEQSWPYVQAYSGANQILIGETLGQTMLQAREAARAAGMEFKSPGGNLLVFQHPEGEKTGVERMKGFLAVTADEPFNIIHTEWGPNSPETGYQIGSQVVPKYKGKFDFLFVSNQQAANGIIRALKENGIAPGKDVYIVSGDCSGSLDAVKNGETFGTGIQPAAVEGALAVRTAAKYAAHGKIEGDIIQLVVEAEAPAIENTPPAKYNYMPHAPAIGADGVASTKIWGDTADEICAAG